MSSITRIYVCGAHSTGKTTLINDLKPHLKNIRVEEEIARNIIRKYNWNRDDFLPDRNPGNFEKLNTEILMTHIEIDQENESKGIGRMLFLYSYTLITSICQQNQIHGYCDMQSIVPRWTFTHRNQRRDQVPRRSRTERTLTHSYFCVSEKITWTISSEVYTGIFIIVLQQQQQSSTLTSIDWDFWFLFLVGWLVGWLVSCIEDLRRFSGISAISQLGRRR